MNAILINEIALGLYALFGATVVAGVLLVWRSRGSSLFVGALFVVLGLGGTGLLTLMASKYWFGDRDILSPLIAVSLTDLAFQIGSTFLMIALMGAAIYGLLRWGRPRLASGRWAAVALVPTVLIVALAAGGIASLIELSRDPDAELAEHPDRKVIAAPGFDVSVYAKGPIKTPTSLAMGPDGRMYVSDFKGHIWAIADRNGVAQEPELYAEDLDRPIGLAWRDDLLYVAVHSRVLTLRDTDGDGRADEQKEILTGLPARLYPWHQNNGFAFGPDGRLYFSIGATNDHAEEVNPMAARIVSVNPDGSDLQIFAEGVRNAYDLAFNAAGDLFATENQPAGLEPVPGEELNHIVKGGHYGFPYYYEQPPPDSDTIGPVYVFPPHASVNGITFYHGKQFPDEYWDNAFTPAWMRGELYRVQLTKSPGGEYTARTSMLVSGMVNPLDVIVGPGDALYVADFATHEILKVSYVGHLAGAPSATRTPSQQQGNKQQ